MATALEEKGVRAVLRGYRMSASKVREVLDLIRNKHVATALDILANTDREAALMVGKLLASAIANAANNHGLVPDELYVSVAYADEGVTMKRFKPRARGSASRIRKRTAHVTIVVDRMPQAKIDVLRAKQASEAEARRTGRRSRRPARRAKVADQAQEALSQVATNETERNDDQGLSFEDSQVAQAQEVESELVTQGTPEAVDVETVSEEDKGAE